MHTTRLFNSRIALPANQGSLQGLPTAHEKKVATADDRYEAGAKTYLESTGLIKRTHNQLACLHELASTTARFGRSKAILEKVETLSYQLRSEPNLSRKKLFEFRQRMNVIEHEIGKMRCGIFLEAFKSFSKDTRAHLRTLSLVKTLLDGDLKAASVKMGKPKPADTVFAENEILHRMDPQMLKAFAGAGICESMNIDERRDLEESFAERRRALDRMAVKKHDNVTVNSFITQFDDLTADEGKLNSQVLSERVYFNLRDLYWPVLDRLCVFLDENGISMISRSRMNRQILESLYREQLELLHEFGVVEKLEKSEVDRLVKEGLCRLTDFVRTGEHYCRIHNDGLSVLKGFLANDVIQVSPQKPIAGGPADLKLEVELY